MSILIQKADLNGRECDILVEGQYITRIEKHIEAQADHVLCGKNKAAIPGFVNGHTHAAMTLFRGLGDDMPLKEWLEQKIWPYEAKLTEEDIYWGAKLACLEMIKSGTTTFNDMYHHCLVTARVVEEMGIRATLAIPCFDHFNEALQARCKEDNIRFFSNTYDFSDRIRFGLGPHAIYTVSGEFLQWIDRFSEERNLPVHLHLAETIGEVNESVAKFGLTPVRYLHKLGVLSHRLILAHCIYVDEEEIKLLAANQVKVVHNPASNMKLASGMEFRFDEMRQAGITVGLGTDGCASSNNLDMVEAMKLACLLGKAWRKDPEAVTAEHIFESATTAGADLLGYNAGRLAPGQLADICLVDKKMPTFVPDIHFTSNLVYAANGSCIDTVICNGRILMENKYVPGEEEILKRATRQGKEILKR